MALSSPRAPRRPIFLDTPPVPCGTVFTDWILARVRVWLVDHFPALLKTFAVSRCPSDWLRDPFLVHYYLLGSHGQHA
jgi:hypothetical protein